MPWQLYTIIGVAAAFAVWYWWYAIARFTMRTDLWEWLLRNIVRKIRFTWAYTSMTGRVYRKVARLVQPGDLLVTIDRARASSKGTPGEWAHGAIYIGPNGEVAEMTGDGFQIVDLSMVCFHSDDIAVWRCRDWDDEYIHDVILPTCFELKGTEYDPAFSLEPEDGKQPLYCFELWWAVDKEKRLKLKHDTILGEPAITGESLTEAENAFCVFNSQRSESSRRFRR